MGSYLLLQESAMETGVIERDLRGRAKKIESSVSRGLCTGLAWGGFGDSGTGKGADTSSKLNHRALGAAAAWRAGELVVLIFLRDVTLSLRVLVIHMKGKGLSLFVMYSSSILQSLSYGVVLCLATRSLHHPVVISGSKNC